MATVTITQVQLAKATEPDGRVTNYYWNTDFISPMSIDPTRISAVGFVWDSIAEVFIPGIIQIYIQGIGTILSTNTYESIVLLLNPIPTPS
jgi:hypothetical protein